jgi:hypothetical protein
MPHRQSRGPNRLGCLSGCTRCFLMAARRTCTTRRGWNAPDPAPGGRAHRNAAIAACVGLPCVSSPPSASAGTPGKKPPPPSVKSEYRLLSTHWSRCWTESPEPMMLLNLRAVRRGKSGARSASRGHDLARALCYASIIVLPITVKLPPECHGLHHLAGQGTLGLLTSLDIDWPAFRRTWAFSIAPKSLALIERTYLAANTARHAETTSSAEAAVSAAAVVEHLPSDSQSHLDRRGGGHWTST